MANLQASILAAVVQVVALVVGFGILNNADAALVINAATAVVNVAFIAANAYEQGIKAKVAAGLYPK